MDRTTTPIATSLFEFVTAATADQVWAALTQPESAVRSLYGMVLESSWGPGAPISVHLPESSRVGGSRAGEVLAGEVLAVQPARRLSYALSAGGPDQPVTYVTWELEALEQGTQVRLYVDEPDSPVGEDGADAAWGPAVSALQSVLARLRR